MSSKKKGNESDTSPLDFKELLSLVSIVLSADVIHGRDNSLSLIRLYDRIVKKPDAKGLFKPMLALCVEFARNQKVPEADFNNSEPEIKICIKNPSGELLDIGEFEIQKVEERKWNFTRTVLILTEHLGFKSIGEYHFVVFGKTRSSEYEFFGARPLLIVEPDESAEND